MTKIEKKEHQRGQLIREKKSMLLKVTTINHKIIKLNTELVELAKEQAKAEFTTMIDQTEFPKLPNKNLGRGNPDPEDSKA